MTETTAYEGPFEYRVRARNTAGDSENKIHDDRVAARYGFRSGLVPGVVIFGYMTVPVVEAFGSSWLEHGSIKVTFKQPFYDGDEVTVRADLANKSGLRVMSLSAERGDRTRCAIGEANAYGAAVPTAPPVGDYAVQELPGADQRPYAERKNLWVGRALGTLRETLELDRLESFAEQLGDPLPVYRGRGALAHPAYLLSMANHVMMQNFELGPWVHVESEVTNWSAAREGETLSVGGRIAEVFERKGHEFAVLDLLVAANGVRVVQLIRHTLIYLLMPS